MIGYGLWNMVGFWLFDGCVAKDAKTCPNGLLPIPTESPEFCMQPFEATLSDDQTAISQSGQIPSIHVSLIEAMQACERTHVDGAPLKLVTYREWVQAGGPHTYPWGPSYQNQCVLDTPSTHGKWSGVEKTGSMSDCVGEYGVYDQIGNAWEWVDLEQQAQRDQWIGYLKQQGHTATVSQTKIEVPQEVLNQLKLQTVCVFLENIALEQELLVVNLKQPIAEDCLTGGKGYLWFQKGEGDLGESVPEPGSLLPVELWGDRIIWDKERDGEPVGAKVGGSFYSGGESTTRSLWIGHIPSFDGSIGFRCVQHFD